MFSLEYLNENKMSLQVQKTFKHQLFIAAIFVFDDLFKLRSLKWYPNKQFEETSSYKNT
jgi:hypothetical protein